MRSIQIMMKQILLFASMVPFTIYSQADIEGLLVEKYYVSDANDATDTDGGTLEEGSITYRVFLDLAPGVKLRSIYANENHLLSLTSTELIWNNADRGKPFGYQIDDARLDENTVALDSWFSFGRSSDVHFGVPKEADTDGSVIGGTNNDGGSESVEGGLLNNLTEDMGLALTVADGLVISEAGLSDVVVVGDNPSSVFDDQTISSSFMTNNMTMLLSDGASGSTEDNHILVAQITTKGELEFQFNVEIINTEGEVLKYVADGTNLQEDETVSAFLKYPPTCGCTDPDFLEYDPAAGCDDGSCATVVVIGCADTLACNYDPAVNLNVQELCCILPDNCNGLDPSLICEGVSVEDVATSVGHFQLFPNPFQDQLTIVADATFSGDVKIEVMDFTGRLLINSNINGFASGEQHKLDMSACERGLYMIRIWAGGSVQESKVIRQ